MTIPAAATKVHLDASTDDPKQARVELAALIDKFNELRSHVETEGGGGIETFLETVPVTTAVGSVILNAGDWGDYDEIVARFIGVKNANNSVNGLYRVQVGGVSQTGSIYKTGIGGSGGASHTSTTSARLDTATYKFGTATGGASGEIIIPGAGGTLASKSARSFVTYSGHLTYGYDIGANGTKIVSASAFDGLEFFFSAGNVTAGDFHLIGRKYA